MKISTKVRIQNTIKFIVQKDEIHEILSIHNERQLDISERTVQVHRLSAYRKLDVHNTAELAPITVLLERGKLGDVNGWEPPAG